MPQDNVAARTRKLIGEHLGQSVTETHDMVSLHDLGADNLDKQEMIIELEDEFGIEFTEEQDEEFRGAQTVAAWVSAVQSAVKS